MFPLGHIGITVFLARCLGLNLTAVAIAALLPDLIDKPALLLTGVGYAKYLGHTLIAVTAVTWLSALLRRGMATSVFFGMLMHLVEDALTAFIEGWGNMIPWLYPFGEYNLLFLTNYHPLENYVALSVIGFDILGALLLLHIFQAEAHGHVEPLVKRINELKR